MVNRKTAIVLGMGQDSMYLTPLLLSKGYRVLGGVRRSSQPRDYLFSLIEQGLEVIECDITDSHCVASMIEKYKPDYVYNLAAMSHVHTSFSSPESTFLINTIGVINILEAIKDLSSNTRLYQASTSELFGRSYTKRLRFPTIEERIKSTDTYMTEKYQDEKTPFIPQSPYAIAKLAAHESIRLYRESYGLFACSGILFNHESEYRGVNFVTRKITRYIGELITRLNRNEKNIDKLKLGNLDAYRDWSHAQDMVEAMVLILEAEKPNDYVCGSGETHSIREFLQKAFSTINLDWEDWVEVNPNLKRPAEVDYLRSDPTKIKTELGWSPKISFDELVERMVIHDIQEQKILDYVKNAQKT